MRVTLKKKDKILPLIIFIPPPTLFCPAASSRVGVQRWPRDCGIPAACVEDRRARRGQDRGRGRNRGDGRSHSRGSESLDPIPSSDTSLQLHRPGTVEQHCQCTHRRIWYKRDELNYPSEHQGVNTQTTHTIISLITSLPSHSHISEQLELMESGRTND